MRTCLFHGVDLGETLYGMAVVGWFALGTLPLGAIALAVLLFGWIIVTIQDRRRAKAGRDRL
jgi:threonine/homoserine efflux transporter RhtA